MREKIVPFALGALLVALSVPAAAQPPTKVYRIGWLSHFFPPSEPDPREEAFWQGLHDPSYVKGQKLVME